MAGFNALGPRISWDHILRWCRRVRGRAALGPGGLREGAYHWRHEDAGCAPRRGAAAFSGISAAFILAVSRAIGETMIVASAAGQQPRFTANPLVPIKRLPHTACRSASATRPPGRSSTRPASPSACCCSCDVRAHLISNSLAAGSARLLMTTAPAEAISVRTSRLFGDRLLQATALLVLPLALTRSAPSLRRVFGGLGRLDWQSSRAPVATGGRGGDLSALIGSLYVMALTAALALPIASARRFYLKIRRRRRLSAADRDHISNLAGVPRSLWSAGARPVRPRLGLGRRVVRARRRSRCCAAVVILSTREALRAVPKTIRKIVRTGATKWQTIWHQVLPNATPGVLTGLSSRSRARSASGAAHHHRRPDYVPFAPTASVALHVLPIQIYNWVSRPQARSPRTPAAASSSCSPSC